ncbi:hypothetical protein LXL04_028309 [Taraxacum kok-saghyz]
MTPFQVLYGRPIPNMNLDTTLSEHAHLFSLLRENLRRDQERMNALANSHRMEKQFNFSDLFYVQLCDYRQKAVQFRASKKLNKRFYGIFKVLELIGKVAYHLEFTPESRIHHVFHVSLLRQVFGNFEPTPMPDYWAATQSQIELENELVS